MLEIPYFKPWINQNDKNSVINALNNRWLTNGPILKKFENELKNYLGTKFSSGVGSATHALHLAMRSLGIGPNDEVIVPTFTFVATANAVRYCGAKPILVDVDLDTFNISTNEIKRKITKKTKAIIPVHFGGQSCDMKEIVQISKKHDLHVVEDCAHSLGSTYDQKKCGSIGDIGCFSFYATKVITTGEGGLVTTKSKKIFEKIQLLRSQAMSIQAKDREKKAKWKYDVVDLGYNYRLDEIRSSLGLSQFQRLDEINKLRQKIAEKYDKKISKIKGITIPSTKKLRNHIYHLYTIKIDKEYPLTRDQLFTKLHKNGIGSSVQYYPLHLMSEFKDDYKNKNDFSNSNILKDQVLCLPIFPKMTNKEIDFVVSILK
jgi:perosamine synthetase